MSLIGIAKETLAVVERGNYTAPDGTVHEIGAWQAASEAGTRLWTPSQLQALLADTVVSQETRATTVEVTMESTQAAIYRLAVQAGKSDIGALNFASARRVGGGFLTGSKAQEEDVARCSGLYPTLLRCPEYYEFNRARSCPLYSDHMIYSPGVPFFRVAEDGFCNQPFRASIITAPAPHAGEARAKENTDEAAISQAMAQRIGLVLALAKAEGCRNLVLGAWGCGVFRNDPEMVAGHFATWLDEARFKYAFDHIVFAVYSKKNHPNLTAFRQRFSA